MRQRGGIRGYGGEDRDQAGGLSRKHRQHLVLEHGVAQRHAVEMLEIDRTVIGSKRRRWHPVDPFQMMRHGDNPSHSPQSIRQRDFRQPTMEMVKGTLLRLPQVRLVFGEKSPS